MQRHDHKRALLSCDPLESGISKRGRKQKDIKTRKERQQQDTQDYNYR